MSHWLIYNYDHSYDFQSHVGLCKYLTAPGTRLHKTAVIPKSLFFCENEIWHFSHIENSLFQIPRGLRRYKNVRSNHFNADAPTWEKHPRTLWCTFPVSRFGKCTNVWRPRSSQSPGSRQDSHVVWKRAWKERRASPGVPFCKSNQIKARTSPRETALFYHTGRKSNSL